MIRQLGILGNDKAAKRNKGGMPGLKIGVTSEAQNELQWSRVGLPGCEFFCSRQRGQSGSRSTSADAKEESTAEDYN